MPGGASIPLLQLFRAGRGVFCVLELDDHGADFKAATGVMWLKSSNMLPYFEAAALDAVDFRCDDKV